MTRRVTMRWKHINNERPEYRQTVVILIPNGDDFDKYLAEYNPVFDPVKRAPAHLFVTLASRHPVLSEFWFPLPEEPDAA